MRVFNKMGIKYVVPFTILIFAPTTALCAQTNTGRFGKRVLENSNAILERTMEWNTQTKTGSYNYLYWNKNASCNLGTFWINGIPKELDIFVSQDYSIYTTNDIIYITNKETRKLLQKWKYGEMQILPKSEKIQIPFQFAVDNRNSNAHGLMKLGLIAAEFYFNKNGRLGAPLHFYLNGRYAYTPQYPSHLQNLKDFER